jgi:hypothetical protein
VVQVMRARPGLVMGPLSRFSLLLQRGGRACSSRPRCSPNGCLVGSVQGELVSAAANNGEPIPLGEAPTPASHGPGHKLGTKGLFPAALPSSSDRPICLRL